MCMQWRLHVENALSPKTATRKLWECHYSYFVIRSTMQGSWTTRGKFYFRSWKIRCFSYGKRGTFSQRSRKLLIKISFQYLTYGTFLVDTLFFSKFCSVFCFSALTVNINSSQCRQYTRIIAWSIFCWPNIPMCVPTNDRRIYIYIYAWLILSAYCNNIWTSFLIGVCREGSHL